jgi:hypothetical protein
MDWHYIAINPKCSWDRDWAINGTWQNFIDIDYVAERRETILSSPDKYGPLADKIINIPLSGGVIYYARLMQDNDGGRYEFYAAGGVQHGRTLQRWDMVQKFSLIKSTSKIALNLFIKAKTNGSLLQMR